MCGIETEPDMAVRANSDLGLPLALKAEKCSRRKAAEMTEPPDQGAVNNLVWRGEWARLLAGG